MTKPTPTHVHTAIIGAGISGLTAGKMLSDYAVIRDQVRMCSRP